jgi:hypothetical protein
MEGNLKLFLKRCVIILVLNVDKHHLIILKVIVLLKDYTRSWAKYLDKHNPWGDFLQACAYVIISNYHTTLQASTGQLVFGRVMINDVPFEENWDRIKNDKQKIIEKSNKRESLNRLKYKYKVGDRILLRNPGLKNKLLAPE